MIFYLKEHTYYFFNDYYLTQLFFRLFTEGGDKHEGKTPKERITDNLNMKLEECEKKKENYLLLERKINKLPDGPEKRKLIYGRNLREKDEKRRNKSPVDIERQLHESYQMILKVRLYFLFSIQRFGCK